jgi:hypothetical protein
MFKVNAFVKLLPNMVSSNGAAMGGHFGGGGRGGPSNLKKEAKNSVETSEGGKESVETSVLVVVRR